MSETFFKIVFVALWLTYILIRDPYDTKCKQEEKIKTLDSQKEKYLLFLMSLGLLFIPLLWVFTPFLNDYKVDFSIWVRWLGVAMSIGSLFYFWWIHKALGVNWSPKLEIRKGHQLIKTGPYKNIRHPMYAQIWLWTIAQVLIISNLIAGFSGIVACAIFYYIRVSREEKMMIENFGDEYIEYMKQTGRVFPKI